jgi:hypothetical protein
MYASCSPKPLSVAKRRRGNREKETVTDTSEYYHQLPDF